MGPPPPIGRQLPHHYRCVVEDASPAISPGFESVTRGTPLELSVRMRWLMTALLCAGCLQQLVPAHKSATQTKDTPDLAEAAQPQDPQNPQNPQMPAAG